MEPEQYPQELTEDEADLGFQHLLVDGIVRNPLDTTPTPVVAKVLSPYDVIVKARDFSGNVIFSHRRHGYIILNGQKTRTMWRVVSGPHSNVAMFLHEHELDLRADVWDDVIGVPFEFKVL